MTTDFVTYATNPRHPLAGKSREGQVGGIENTLAKALDRLRGYARQGYTHGGIDLVTGPDSLTPLYRDWFLVDVNDW